MNLSWLLGRFGRGGGPYPKVSVIIPNYNYGRFLHERLQSIFNQTYPIHEVVFLDDASTDDSVQLFRQYVAALPRKRRRMNIRMIVGETNSGNVFKQWAKGIEAAEGSHIWIAEADDYCSETFLESMMAGFRSDERIVLGYAQSRQADEEGTIYADDYLTYTNEIDTERWKTPYVRNGIDEIKDTLVVKNTIPNASGVVFKKFDVREIEPRMTRYRILGDLCFYVWMLEKGRIYYHPQSLNTHRRHPESVALKYENKRILYREIVDMQDDLMARFEIDEATLAKVYAYRYTASQYYEWS